MAVNIFQNSSKTIPTSDQQIVRVSMDEIEIGGRKDHLPAQGKSQDLSIQHVPSMGSSR